MKLVYEWEMGGDGGEDTRLNLLEIQPDDENKPYVDELVAGVQAHPPEWPRCASRRQGSHRAARTAAPRWRHPVQLSDET